MQKSNAMEVEREPGERKRKNLETDDEGNEIEDDESVNKSPKLLSSIYNYLVVLSIILIVFAAFRNSVTW